MRKESGQFGFKVLAVAENCRLLKPGFLETPCIYRSVQYNMHRVPKLARELGFIVLIVLSIPSLIQQLMQKFVGNESIFCFPLQINMIY